MLLITMKDIVDVNHSLVVYNEYMMLPQTQILRHTQL